MLKMMQYNLTNLINLNHPTNLINLNHLTNQTHLAQSHYQHHLLMSLDHQDLEDLISILSVIVSKDLNPMMSSKLKMEIVHAIPHPVPTDHQYFINLMYKFGSILFLLYVNLYLEGYFKWAWYFPVVLILEYPFRFAIIFFKKIVG